VQVGILELLAMPAQGQMEAPYDFLMLQQFASVTPQAIACWCRRLGHRVFYATYYGLGSPERLLPDDPDLVFISAYTQASPLASAVSARARRHRLLSPSPWQTRLPHAADSPVGRALKPDD
jgi:hypothetical protein